MDTDEFVATWRCGNPTHQKMPGGCWSSSHILLRDLERDVRKCALTCTCWRHIIIDYVAQSRDAYRFMYSEPRVIMKRDQVTPSERHAMTTSKLSRAEVVQQQLRALQAEMAHLARFPEDNFPEHTVLMTQKTIKRPVPARRPDGAFTYDPYNGETWDKAYTYVLLKANGQWWMTGTNGHGINGASWDKVIDFVDGDDLIDVRTGLSVMLDSDDANPKLNDRDALADRIGEAEAAKVVKFLEDPSTGVTGLERPTRDES